MFQGKAILAAVCVSSALALAGPAQAQKRVAFVVGVDRYDNLGPQQQLQRAVSDARAVGAILGSLGYEVIAAENVSRPVFNAQWAKFLDKLQPGDTAAVYFSGHGVEIEGLNFLLPRDVPNVSFGRQEQIKRESLSVSEMLLDLRPRKPQVTLVILDACRDNPLGSSEHRSAGSHGGLARMEPPEGTFIMYSAGAGETALDRLPGNDPDKINSVYTRRLLPLLTTPGLALPELARQLRSEVRDLTAPVPHVQRPAYYDGLIGTFCVAGCESAAATPAPTSKPAAPERREASVSAPPAQTPGPPGGEVETINQTMRLSGGKTIDLLDGKLSFSMIGTPYGARRDLVGVRANGVTGTLAVGQFIYINKQPYPCAVHLLAIHQGQNEADFGLSCGSSLMNVRLNKVRVKVDIASDAATSENFTLSGGTTRQFEPGGILIAFIATPYGARRDLVGVRVHGEAKSMAVGQRLQVAAGSRACTLLLREIHVGTNSADFTWQC